MGDMDDILNEYLNQMGQDFNNYNRQDFIHWLAGSEEHEEEYTAREQFELQQEMDEYAEKQKRIRVVTHHLQQPLGNIFNMAIRQFVNDCIFSYAPSIYWSKPSAFHKGHHPMDEHSQWGNFKHVKRTIIIASMLSEAEQLSQHENDLLIAALIIHDIGKYGVDGKMKQIQKNHMELVRQMIPKDKRSKDIEEIISIAETHAGQWGLIKPKTKLQKLCHYADYIASRNNISIPMHIEGSY